MKKTLIEIRADYVGGLKKVMKSILQDVSSEDNKVSRRGCIDYISLGKLVGVDAEIDPNNKPVKEPKIDGLENILLTDEVAGRLLEAMANADETEVSKLKDGILLKSAINAEVHENREKRRKEHIADAVEDK